MIYTREELIHKIAYIMSKYNEETPFNYKCAEEIVDLIATLNDQQEDILKGTRHKSEVKSLWKNVP